MDIQYYGANCILLTNKDFRIVIDDNLSEVGIKSILKQNDVTIFTSAHKEIDVQSRITIDQPGEYEIADLSILGIAAQGYRDDAGSHNATMYKVNFNDVSYLFTGHIYPELSDYQVETIGMVDVMFVPVGNNGYTLDAGNVIKLIKKIEPKIIVPTHYADTDIHYEVDQQSLSEALNGLSMEAKETTAKLHVKPGELLAGANPQLIILSRA